MASLDYKGHNSTSYIRYRINGKMFRKNIGKVCKAAAKQILYQFEEKLALHKMGISTPKQISLALFLQDYMEWVKYNQAPNTYLSKCLAQKNLLRFLESNLRGFDKYRFELQELSNAIIEK